MDKISWVGIEHYYISTPSASYNVIAKKYGVPEDKVEWYAKENQWAKKRRIFLELTLRDVNDLAVHKQVKAQARHIETLELIHDLFSTQLKHFQKLAQRNGRLSEANIKKVRDMFTSLHKAMMAERTMLTDRFKLELDEEGHSSEEANEIDIEETIKDMEAFIDHHNRRKKLIEENRKLYSSETSSTR